jgi:GNAT superfamily N-acetyltransferase
MNKYVSYEEQQKVLSHLKPALPNDFVALPGDKIQSYLTTTPGARLQGLTSPPGTCIHSFSAFGDTYEIWIATYKDKGAARLLHRAERAAMWFIETADGIDFSDDRWEALFLFKTTEESIPFSDCDNSAHGIHSVNSRSPARSPRRRNHYVKEYFFAGYYTLFTFRNPFSGSRLRVCQALILPNLQGKGLGQEMMLATYRLARERNDVTEVTVEHPAPGFEKMRDLVDCEWALRVHKEMTLAKEALNVCIPDRPDTCDKLAKKQHGKDHKHNPKGPIQGGPYLKYAGGRHGNSANTNPELENLTASTVREVLQRRNPVDRTNAAYFPRINYRIPDVCVHNDALTMFGGSSQSCAKELKITVAQATFVLEALRYCALERKEDQSHSELSIDLLPDIIKAAYSTEVSNSNKYTKSRKRDRSWEAGSQYSNHSGDSWGSIENTDANSQMSSSTRKSYRLTKERLEEHDFKHITINAHVSGATNNNVTTNCQSKHVAKEMVDHICDDSQQSASSCLRRSRRLGSVGSFENDDSNVSRISHSNMSASHIPTLSHTRDTHAHQSSHDGKNDGTKDKAGNFSGLVNGTHSMKSCTGTNIGSALLLKPTFSEAQARRQIERQLQSLMHACNFGAVEECSGLRSLRLDIKRRMLAGNKDLRLMETEKRQKKLSDMYETLQERFACVRKSRFKEMIGILQDINHSYAIMPMAPSASATLTPQAHERVANSS